MFTLLALFHEMFVQYKETKKFCAAQPVAVVVKENDISGKITVFGLSAVLIALTIYAIFFNH